MARKRVPKQARTKADGRATARGKGTARKKPKPMKSRVHEAAMAILKTHPEGMRFGLLLDRAMNKVKGAKRDYAAFLISRLDQDLPEQVQKPARGFLQMKGPEEEIEVPIEEGRGEEKYYDGVAEYLTDELSVCTRAYALGGNALKDKWSTPDVVGVRRSELGHIVKAPMEIVSVEVKGEQGDLLTAFAQAVMYRLFSHESYLFVTKKAIDSRDFDRIQALCSIFGIGLVLFDAKKKKPLECEVRARAMKGEPDWFYVNRYMNDLPEELKTKLFG